MLQRDTFIEEVCSHWNRVYAGIVMAKIIVLLAWCAAVKSAVKGGSSGITVAGGSSVGVGTETETAGGSKNLAFLWTLKYKRTNKQLYLNK